MEVPEGGEVVPELVPGRVVENGDRLDFILLAGTIEVEVGDVLVCRDRRVGSCAKSLDVQTKPQCSDPPGLEDDRAGGQDMLGIPSVVTANVTALVAFNEVAHSPGCVEGVEEEGEVDMADLEGQVLRKNSVVIVDEVRGTGVLLSDLTADRESSTGCLVLNIPVLTLIFFLTALTSFLF